MRCLLAGFALALFLSGCEKSLSSSDSGSGNPDLPEPTQSCVDATRCLIETGCYAQICAGDCVAGTDADTRERLQTIYNCAKGFCEGIGYMNASQMAFCVAASCQWELEPCTSTGSHTCSEALDCAESCTSEGTCYLDCLDKATYEGRLLTLALASCMESECPGAIWDGPQGFLCLTDGPCEGEYYDCMDHWE